MTELDGLKDPPYTKFNEPGAGKATSPSPFDTDSTFVPRPSDLGSGSPAVPNVPGVNLRSPEYLVRTLRDLLEYEKSKKLPLEQKVRESWASYNSEARREVRDEWQSNHKFPSYWMTVKRVAGKLMQMLERGQHWFEVEALVPEKQIWHNLVKNWVMYWLQHPTVRWRKALRNLMENGLVTTQMGLMIVPEVGRIDSAYVPDFQQDDLLQEEQFDVEALSLFTGQTPPSTRADQDPFIPNPDMPKLRLEVMDPQYLWIDSSTSVPERRKHIIWQTRVSVGEFLNQSAKRGYDVDACKRAASKIVADTERMLEDSRKQEGSGLSALFPEIVLTHFEGTLYHPATGEAYVEREYFVVANDAELVLPPVKIPFWDRMPSILFAPLLDRPNAAYGQSYLVENLDTFLLKDNLLRKVVDFLNMSLDPPVEIDYDLIDTTVLDGGSIHQVHPGQHLPVRRSNGNTQPAIRAASMAELSANNIGLFQYAQNLFGEFVGITQEMQNMPRTRGRLTGMEFEARHADGGDLLLDLFRRVEEDMLTPFLHMVCLRQLQYTPQAMWRAWNKAYRKAILPDAAHAPKEGVTPEQIATWEKMFDEAAEWTPQQRFSELAGYFQFIPRAFSSAFERQKEIEKATYFIQTAKSVPTMQQMIRWDYVIRQIAGNFEWDPEKVLVLGVQPQPSPEEQHLVNNGPDSPIQVPNFLTGFPGQAFQQVDQGDTMDNASGSPFSGTGAPRSQAVNPPKLKGF